MDCLLWVYISFNAFTLCSCIAWRQSHIFDQSIYLTVVTVQFLKVYRLRIIFINKLKDCQDLLLGKWSVQSLQNSLELRDCQLSISVSIVSVVSGKKSQLLICQNFVQLQKTSLHLYLQLTWHLLRNLSWVNFLHLLLQRLTKRYTMFLHLSLQFFHRYWTISIGVHLLKEKFDLFFSYFWMNMFQKICELIVV